MSLGENIKKRRRNANLTQEELGYIVGVHPNTIRKWEKGTSSPNATELKHIADALKTTTDDLYFEAGTMATFIKNSAYQDKTEIQNSIPSMAYWGSLVDNAEKTAENGRNLEVIIGLVKTALNILETAINRAEKTHEPYVIDTGNTSISQFTQ
ncbi:MAG: helix-turn-helix transcriptional regulator [Synergistaceae bacterium]|nr:helix-turn-helix transcriptional regulator [Synergistaceae bacterium]